MSAPFFHFCEAEMTAEEIVRKHRRHVELSPGAGEEVQRYALAVCDDILSDLAAQRYVHGEAQGEASYGDYLDAALMAATGSILSPYAAEKIRNYALEMQAKASRKCEGDAAK